MTDTFAICYLLLMGACLAATASAVSFPGYPHSYKREQADEPSGQAVELTGEDAQKAAGKVADVLDALAKEIKEGKDFTEIADSLPDHDVSARAIYEGEDFHKTANYLPDHDASARSVYEMSKPRDLKRRRRGGSITITWGK